GKTAGICVAIGDIAKGFAAASLPFILNVDINSMIIGAFAIIGHCFPIFAGFKGGKAIATTAGVFIYINPLIFLTGLITFFSVILITKYVVYGSLSAGLSIFIHSLLIQDKLMSIITG